MAKVANEERGDSCSTAMTARAISSGLPARLVPYTKGNMFRSRILTFTLKKKKGGADCDPGATVCCHAATSLGVFYEQ